MSDTSSAPSPVVATTRRSRRISAIWIIPLLAVGIGLWLAWETLSKEGPVITITFETAEGLQTGQSQLKFKDLVIGTVKGLKLTPDRKRVIVTIATTQDAKDLITDDTVFWVVKPRLFAGNLSGLETLLSGSYVGMMPGRSDSHAKRDFTGSENPPVIQANVPGRTFLLKASRLGSISLGSPVFYRDLQVGEVLGWDLADMAESVTIHAFVRAPFDSYVHDQTRFWNASGLSVKLGGTGVEVQLESVRALVLGGLAFDTPGLAPDQKATHDTTVFPLFPDRDTAAAASYSRNVSVLAYFNGSVRGLAPGADVVMHGLKVGQVLDVRLELDRANRVIRAPVRFEIQPERIIGVGSASLFATPLDAAQAMVNRGMRARLDSASLLTGQQIVSLEFDQNAPAATVSMVGADILIPSAEGAGLAGLQASAAALLDNVNQIPFAKIGKSLEGILASAQGVANDPQTRQTLNDVSAAVRSFTLLAQKVELGLAPALKQLPEITAGLQKSLTSANRLMVSLDNGYGDNTKFSRDLERLLVQVNDAVRSIRTLADLLTRHPEALLKGRTNGGLE